MSSSGQRPKSHEMTKTTYLPDDSVTNDKKKKSIIPKIFGSKLKNEKGSEENIFSGNDAFHDRERRYTTGRTKYLDANPMIRKSFSERQSSRVIEGFNLSHYIRGKKNDAEVQDFRIFVATWNVGGKCPDDGLNLEDFLQVEGSSDIYIVGFQEIVPLNAGNVLVVEDNEPAAKWLCLINQALNRATTTTTTTDSFHKDADCSVSESPSTRSTKDSKASAGGLLFFQKPSLKVISRKFRANASHLKTCNCNPELALQLQQRRSKDLKDTSSARDESGEEESITCLSGAELPAAPQDQMSYCLISSKQMVGIFLSVWARHELVRHIGHLRVCTVGTGIMGCLGNKGCISVSMTLHQTSFCFVCSHLASGEKEGDELRRNADVAEILKSTQFPRICKSPNQRIPEKILDHDRVIWLGDLNYRIALSYNETRVLLEGNDWDALLEKDQLRMEMEAGRVFTGWSEGRILFAPTYKYSQNSDAYAGETVKSKKKRRTPAWCDRILWHGDGIEQLSYIRVESRFSDHRPVCAVFVTEIQMQNSGNSSNNNYRGRKSYSSAVSRMEVDDCIPQRRSSYEY